MHNGQVVTVRMGGNLDLDQTHKVIANVLGKLGCPRCFSGFDIRFAHINELVINPKTLDVTEIAGPLSH